MFPGSFKEISPLTCHLYLGLQMLYYWWVLALWISPQIARGHLEKEDVITLEPLSVLLITVYSVPRRALSRYSANIR